MNSNPFVKTCIREHDYVVQWYSGIRSPATKDESLNFSLIVLCEELMRRKVIRVSWLVNSLPFDKTSGQLFWLIQVVPYHWTDMDFFFNYPRSGWQLLDAKRDAPAHPLPFIAFWYPVTMSDKLSWMKCFQFWINSR